MSELKVFSIKKNIYEDNKKVAEETRGFLRENGGRTQIVSSNGYWEEYNGKVTHIVYSNSFMGTIVNIEVDINDKIYISKDEKDEINKIISNIF